MAFADAGSRADRQHDQRALPRDQPVRRVHDLHPWRWRPADVDEFLADRRSGAKPITLTTLRSYRNTIAMFCSYISDNRYGWIAFCEKHFGDVPSQICFEWNTPRHTTGDAVPPRRRAFTRPELQTGRAMAASSNCAAWALILMIWLGRLRRPGTAMITAWWITFPGNDFRRRK
jgi:hypothetical protein